MLSACELIAGVMFRSLLAAAEAKWTAAAQWNQTDRAGANENPESNTVFALRSALPILPKSARRDAVNRQRPIPRHLPKMWSDRTKAGEPSKKR
jgi:hypothetical protein